MMDNNYSNMTNYNDNEIIKVMLRQEERGGYYHFENYLIVNEEEEKKKEDNVGTSLLTKNKHSMNTMTSSSSSSKKTGNATTTADTTTTVMNRQKMIDWYFQIAKFCNFNTETVSIATSYLDRFVAATVRTTKTTTKGESGIGVGVGSNNEFLVNDASHFQLAGMTAFYIAVKIHETEKMDLTILSNLSQGIYTQYEFESMEIQMLNVLQWSLNPPTELEFVRQFLCILSSSDRLKLITTNGHDGDGDNNNIYHYSSLTMIIKDKIYELSKFQTELSLKDHRLITTKKSIIAFALFINSLESSAFFHHRHNRNLIGDIGCFLSNITNIDMCSTEFLEAKYLLRVSLNEEIYSNSNDHHHGDDSKSENACEYSMKQCNDSSRKRKMKQSLY